ncbi:hypothetical protein HELRODRAFT_176023 [Helobdella robusta]|uniref:CCHC-type domain-containing protein n=1 Tax=Helobdella robusta TaxID=6412 RepID=T1FA13_HELRO|nr:hypothetical protein HELRODRAFT_176023 [Helobdella robusta]ESO00189.1 hypothetical protein HELRODRAFT_176023 [Helobdella robusta]
MRRQKEESFVMFAHRLHNTLQFYFQSREVDSFQGVVNLICADRLKELLPKNVLEFVLTQEMDDWMGYEVLAKTVDRHEMNMNMKMSSQPTTSKRPPPVFYKNVSNDARKEDRCYRCNMSGHIARFCNRKPTSTATPKRILKCEVTSKPKWLHVITNESQQRESAKGHTGGQALIDSGAEVCCISEELCESLNLPLGGKLMVRGLEPEGKEVDGISINLKPIPSDERCRVMAPAVKVWCAVIPSLVEGLLITPGVVELLNEVKHYEVPSPVNDDDEQRVGEAMSDCDVEEWSNQDGDEITDEVGRGEGLTGTDNGIDEEGHDEAINVDANEVMVRKDDDASDEVEVPDDPSRRSRCDTVEESGDIEGSAEVAGEVFNDGINGVADKLTMIKEQTN